MSETTAIEWCDSTFNPWIGCTRVSPACDDCYAARSTPARALGVTWGPGEERRRTSAANWALPKRWNAQAEAFQAQHGRRQRVFCASLADVFDNHVAQAWRDDLFALIAATPNLDWLLLTKRIGNAHAMLRSSLQDVERCGESPASYWPWPNVWLGATICNQEEADRDIPKLLTVPARVRFLSIEPMLGPIALRLGWCLPHGAGCLPGLDWVICGGESGPKARPMHPAWARGLRAQCKGFGVPFLFKQWGEWTPGENVERQRGTVDTAFLHEDGWHVYPLNLATDGGHIDDEPDLYRVGKKAAGRHLDGVTHDGFPPTAPQLA